MASQFEDLSKAANGLLKDSFPFDRDGVKAEGKVVLKASAKTPSGSALSVSFDKAAEAQPVGKVEVACKYGEAAIKTSFSTKDATITFSASSVLRGAKVGVEGKVSSDKTAAKVSIAPSLDWSNETAALHTKVEVSGSPSEPHAKSELSLTVKREKISAGGIAKFDDKAISHASLALNYGSFNLGWIADKKDGGLGHNLFYNSLHQFADSKAKLAIGVRVPISLALSEEERAKAVKAAFVFPVNDDTTAGIYADSGLNLASSLRVKVNNNLTVAGSVHSPLGALFGSGSDARVIGLSFELNE